MALYRPAMPTTWWNKAKICSDAEENRAEPVLREAVVILQKRQPDDWSRFRAQSLLGLAFLGQKKYVEAEPLLVEGYEGLKRHEAEIPPLFARHRVREALERVIRLYETLGQNEKAAQWRAKVPSARDAQPKPH